MEKRGKLLLMNKRKKHKKQHKMREREREKMKKKTYVKKYVKESSIVAIFTDKQLFRG